MTSPRPLNKFNNVTLAPRAKDSRRTVRNLREREIVIYPTPDAEAGDAARLADVSTFGMGFVQPRPMPVGAQFVLRLELEEDKVTPLLFRVAYCRPVAGDAFRIGAQLVRVINGSESFEINANTDEGIEFAEAVVEMMGGPRVATSYKMPAPAVEMDDDFEWAILVDSEEFAELVAITERREQSERRRRIAA